MSVAVKAWPQAAAAAWGSILEVRQFHDLMPREGCGLSQPVSTFVHLPVHLTPPEGTGHFIQWGELFKGLPGRAHEWGRQI